MFKARLFVFSLLCSVQAFASIYFGKGVEFFEPVERHNYTRSVVETPPSALLPDRTPAHWYMQSELAQEAFIALLKKHDLSLWQNLTILEATVYGTDVQYEDSFLSIGGIRGKVSAFSVMHTIFTPHVVESAFVLLERLAPFSRFDLEDDRVVWSKEIPINSLQLNLAGTGPLSLSGEVLMEVTKANILALGRSELLTHLFVVINSSKPEGEKIHFYFHHAHLKELMAPCEKRLLSNN